MRVKLLKPISSATLGNKPEGAIVETTDAYGRHLIACGVATAHDVAPFRPAAGVVRLYASLPAAQACDSQTLTPAVDDAEPLRSTPALEPHHGPTLCMPVTTDGGDGITQKSTQGKRRGRKTKRQHTPSGLAESSDETGPV